MISPVNSSCYKSQRNRIGHTKLSFAIFLEHPLLVFQLKDISENWKALWARWNFAPWARYISCCQTDDETQYVTELWCQKLGECSERETKEAPISITATESTDARATGRCSWIESHRFCLEPGGDSRRCIDCILRAFRSSFRFAEVFEIVRPCGINFGSCLVQRNE